MFVHSFDFQLEEISITSGYSPKFEFWLAQISASFWKKNRFVHPRCSHFANKSHLEQSDKYQF
jgi:hypothetical protein